jgi:hypothetical protein
MMLEWVTVIGGSLGPRIARNPGNSKSGEDHTTRFSLLQKLIAHVLVQGGGSLKEWSPDHMECFFFFFFVDSVGF